MMKLFPEIKKDVEQMPQKNCISIDKVGNPVINTC